MSNRQPLRHRFLARALLAIASLALLGCTAPVRAACDRIYTVGVSDGSSFSFMERGNWKGLVPAVLAELTVRTGCHFEVISIPRPRLWLQWSAGSLDLMTTAVQSAERDAEGAFAPFGYAQDVLVSTLAPPGGTLENWLDLPHRPVLGIVRGALSGGQIDSLLSRPRYSKQVETADDYEGLLRKLLAKRTDGLLLPQPTFDKLAPKLGFDPAGHPSHVVTEAPSVARGIYFRTGRVSPADLKVLTSTLDALMKSGFDEAAYADTVGKPLAAHLYRNK